MSDRVWIDELSDPQASAIVSALVHPAVSFAHTPESLAYGERVWAERMSYHRVAAIVGDDPEIAKKRASAKPREFLMGGTALTPRVNLALAMGFEALLAPSAPKERSFIDVVADEIVKRLAR